MNNKGFTLIEVIMVVAIIAVLAILFTPNVIYLMNKNDLNVYNNTISTIEHAAENYVSDNRYITSVVKVKCPVTSVADRQFTVTLGTLYDTGYLTKIRNTTCNKNSNLTFKDDDIVTVKFDCTTKQFSYKFSKNQLKNVSDCKK